MQPTYRERRAKVLEYLGTECAHCGSTSRLEIDHIDPKLKSYDVGARLKWANWNDLVLELAKCQALCHECHKQKSIKYHGHSPVKGTHGTTSSYKYCKCPLCRKAKSDYNAEYKTRKGLRTGTKPRTGLVHGTCNAYQYYGCRCDLCKTAKHEAYKAKRNGMSV
jgi:hypothetical protein